MPSNVTEYNRDSMPFSLLGLRFVPIRKPSAYFNGHGRQCQPFSLSFVR
jgi:hypothetical protein